MENLLMFPSRGRLEDQLQRGLNEMHGLFDEHMEMITRLNELEDTMEEKQVQYDCALEKYSRIVGIENIPIAYLEFGLKNVSFDADTGEISYEREEEEEV